MHIVRGITANKFFIAAAIVFIALLASLSAGKFAFAVDQPSATNKTCYSKNSAIMTNRTSPFSQTQGMCLGDGDSGRRYYQFAVIIDTPTAVRANVTALVNGTTLSFRKESDFLYVSDTSYANGLGYMAVTGNSASCNRNDPANKVVVSADANGKSERIEVNLCDYTSADATLVYKTTTQLKDDAGQGSSTGKILANLGIIREGAPIDHGARKGTLEKRGVTSIKLTGAETLTGDSGSGWFNLSGGALQIKNDGGVKPGIYTLEIAYNDKLLANLSNPTFEPSWTTDNLVLKFTNFKVVAGKDTWLTQENGGVAYYDKDGKLVTDDRASTSDKGSSCNVDGIGWIICPVVTFMAKVTDAAYGFVSSMLIIQPLLTTNPDKGIYGAWSAMRNIANIAFVIAFMIIIFSQVSSVGISNYGIKKMLPRLIAAAILVNVSYWICAIAVDLSNISGGAVRGLFTSVGANIPSENQGNALAIDATTGNGWVGIAGAILAGTVAAGAALYIGLSALLPALIVVLMAIITVVLVLVLRQALIILLIAAAPLAFVAFLLPNTESLFDKWRKLFMTLLLMYPIIAGIFGASALASTIIMEGAKTNTTGYKIAIQIMGAAVAIIPLFITPVVMKTAGGLLNRFGGVINNPSKGPFDRMRKGAQRIRENQEGKRGIRAMNGGVVFGGGRFRRQARRDAVSQGIKNESNRATNQYIAEEIEGNSAFRNRVAGGSRGLYSPNATQEAMQRALSGAKLTIDKAIAEDIQAESVIVRDLDDTKLKGILASPGESDAKKAAAMQRLVKISDPVDYASEVNAAISGTSEILRRATAEALGKDGPGFVKASDVDKIATGAAGKSGTTLQSIAQKNVADGVYSQEKMVDETHGNLQFAFDNAYTVDPTTGAVDRTGQQNMVNTSAALLMNPNLNGKIKHNRTAITDLSVGSRPR